MESFKGPCQILGLILAFSLAGCSMIEVSTDYDPSVDFERLATYDWLPEPHKPTGDPRIDNPLLEKRIRTAVESQLAAKGYEKAGPGRADFLVGYHAAIDRRLSVQSMNTYYGYSSGWGWDQGNRIFALRRGSVSRVIPRSAKGPPSASTIQW